MGTRKVKTKEQLTLEMAQEADKKFLEEYKALVEPLNEKHSRRLIPIIQEERNQYRITQQAVFAIDRYEVIKPQPAHEKREESETN